MKKITSLLCVAFGLVLTVHAQDGVSPKAIEAGSIHKNATTTSHNFTSQGSNTQESTVPAILQGLVDYSTTPYNGTVQRNSGSNLIYETGPYFNVAGNPDISLLEDQTLGMNTLGGGMQIGSNNRMAEDIVLDDEYEITQIDFFGYQTGAPTSPASINEINLQVWDGDPSDPGSTVIWGDESTNVFGDAVWSNAYRESETNPGTSRAIQRVTVNPTGLTLPAGTYWFDWSMAGTAASGPWQPPVVILGEISTGNGQQSIAGAWQPFLDTGTSTQLGAPVQVYGNLVTSGGVACSQGNPPNTPEAAIGSSIDSPFNAAVDVIVADGERFTLDQVTANFLTLASSTEPTLANVRYYTDNAGFPGTEIGSELGIPVTVLSTSPWVNPAANVHEIEFDVTPFAFNGDFGSETTYWVEVTVGNAANSGSIFWEAVNETTAPLVGEPMVQFNGTAWGYPDYDADGTPDDNIEGVYSLSGQCEALPDNDICADAFSIECGETLAGDTSNGNTDGNADGSPDEWFSFTGSGSPQLVTVSLCGSSFDTILTAYDDCSLANVVASNDDSCGTQSEISFLSDGTTTYYFAVDGFNGATGAFDIAITCEDPAENDLCEDAIAISCGESVSGSTLNATSDASAPSCAGEDPTIGVWYKYEDTSGLVTDITLSLCSDDTDFDTKISVYSGDCGTLTCVAANDDGPNCTNFRSEVDFQSDGNTTFYVLVHGYESPFGGIDQGNFTLDMTCTIVPPPNDLIANSIDVDEIGFPYTDPGVQTPGATTENGNPSGCNIDGANGVWYNFVAEGDGEATATIVSPEGLSFVSFYEAPNESATENDLVLVDQNSNQCVPGTETTINTTAGQAYYVFVVNTGGKTDITIDGVNLGVANNTIDGFTYYPNPASSTLSLNSVETIEAVTIYNMLGQSVINQGIEATSSQVDVSGLSTGTYVMKVIVNGQVGTYQIIKE
ncbi:MAG: hypothetical protein CMC08_01860 [Flavobacteriaceae bacterium]|nr:hypothetical protein [Flavobacteriaceae bacterium]